jgi:hypothetical protein
VCDLASAPCIGILAVILIAGKVTIACFVAMFWMLLKPGETDTRHPKYRVMRDDR